MALDAHQVTRETASNVSRAHHFENVLKIGDDLYFNQNDIKSKVFTLLELQKHLQKDGAKYTVRETETYGVSEKIKGKQDGIDNKK